MANNLQEEYEKIMNYLKSNGFKIFFADKTLNQTSQATWDNNHEWEEFFAIAKDNTDMVFVESEIIDQEKISEMERLKEDDPELKFDLQRYSNQMVMFAFSWIKDNVKHELRKTDGPVDIMKKLSQYAMNKKLQMEAGFDDEDEAIPSEREIERRFVEYMEVGRGYIRDYEDKFQRERYINYFFTSEMDFGYREEGKKRKIKKDLESKFDEMLLKHFTKIQETFNEKIPEMVEKYVEFKIKNKIDRQITGSSISEALELQNEDWNQIKLLQSPIQEAWKKYVDAQKEKIPEYVEQALEWMKENNSTKMLKSEIVVFLDDKEIFLPKPLPDQLWIKVQSALKKQ